jgi:hypothetical protein
MQDSGWKIHDPRCRIKVEALAFIKILEGLFDYYNLGLFG